MDRCGADVLAVGGREWLANTARCLQHRRPVLICVGKVCRRAPIDFGALSTVCTGSPHCKTGDQVDVN